MKLPIVEKMKNVKQISLLVQNTGFSTQKVELNPVGIVCKCIYVGPTLVFQCRTPINCYFQHHDAFQISHFRQVPLYSLSMNSCINPYIFIIFSIILVLPISK